MMDERYGSTGHDGNDPTPVSNCTPPEPAAGAAPDLTLDREAPEKSPKTESAPPLSAAVSATPLVALPMPELDTAPTSEERVVRRAAPPPSSGRGWVAMLKPLVAILLVTAATLYLFPLLLARWRAIESQSEADAAYQKRRAELKAEAEAAAQMLDALDQRVNLVSLGFRDVVRKVAPNVVNILNYRLPRPNDPKMERLFPKIADPDNERIYREQGAGSGIIVEPGLILTNHHVVRNADRLRITFASGRSCGLDVEKSTVLHDAVTDLAVIRLPKDLPEAVIADANGTTEFANSDRDVQPGDLVLALGSPLGLKQTVTQGIISAKGRLLDKVTLVELLQTDAAINPGNSGGPLFDRLGRIAGINVAIASDENGGGQGIGFAIPSNTARKVFEHLVTRGEVQRGYIGVALVDLEKKEIEALGLKRSGGVLVTRVEAEEGAGRAGIQPGDAIVGYNGEPLSELAPMRHLRQAILETEVGRQVPIDIIRDGQRLTLQVSIGKRPPDLP